MACGNLFALGCLRHTSPIVILISDDLGDLMSRIAVPALALSLAMGLGLTACNRQQQQQKMPPAAVGYVTIAEQPVPLTVELPGRTNPFVISEIRPQVSGIVQKR